LENFPEPELEQSLHDKLTSGQHAIAVTHKRLNLNVAVTIAVRIAYMVTRVGIPPYVLVHIGLPAWGIWSTAFLLVSLLGISNSGLSNVYIKYVAEYDARKEYDKANALVSTGLSFTLPFCGVLFAMVVVFWPFVARFVNLPAAYAMEGREVFLIVFAVFLSSISLQAFVDVLNGMQEIAMVQWFSLVSYMVEVALIVVLIHMGRGIRGLAEAYLARQIIYFGLCIAYGYYKLRWLHVSPRLFSRRALQTVLHFGGIVQIQTLFATFFAVPERFIAMRVLGPEAVGLFDLSKKWPSSTATIPMSFFSAFLPAASNLYAHSKGEERVSNIRSLYLRGARQSNIVAAYFCSLMALLPAAIMGVWLGGKITHASAADIANGAMTPAQFHDAIILFALFNVGIQIHMLTGTGTSILRGIGRIYQEFWYAIPNLIFLAITCAAARILQHGWTILGIGYAVSAATLLAAIVFLWRAHHVLHIGNAAYLREVLWPGLVPYLVAALFTVPVTHLVAHHGRIAGAGILLGTGVLYTVLLAIVMDWLILHPAEREQWRNLLQRGLRKQPAS
jgi:O-antigen/teichoic acid export membrane protein